MALSGNARVQRLDDRLVDKIAAGEVVERPASVVKELVENALDAGARTVDVAIEAGGVALVRVADDGAGITARDLPLAVARHCTSKLTDAAGLAAISTMGFRGEALPSIGAVARLAITSRAEGADGAWRIEVAGGIAGAQTPAARARGTTLEVRDLFYATPARLKFLKSERAETAAVTDTVRRLVLSAPQVTFSLKVSGRTTRFPAGDAALRARQVLGEAFAEEAVVLRAERHGLRLTGRLGLPTDSRATAQHQYAFVNARVVKDKLIAQALKAGYQDVIAAGRYPMVILNLGLDPREVDVNVHPAKADVRFRDPQQVRGTIVSAVRQALADARPNSARAVSNAALAALSASRPWPAELDRPAEPDEPGGFAEPAARWHGPERRSTFAPAARLVRPQPEASAPEPDASRHVEHPLGAAVAQLHKTYIVAETRGGLVIVDQHAAHERIVYEALKASAAAPASQGLLIPEVVELDRDDVARLVDAAEVLAAVGLVLEGFGPGAVVVRATPAVLKTFDVKALVRDLAEEIAEWGVSDALHVRIDKAAATAACHGSVRSGRALSGEEMNALLRQIEATPSAGQCNHGRPTFVALSLAEIERLFARR